MRIPSKRKNPYGQFTVPSKKRMRSFFHWMSDGDISRLHSLLKSVSTSRQADDAMEKANSIMEGYGTEAIRGKYVSFFWQDAVAVFVNMGDTYDPTLLFDTVKDRFMVTTLGDFVESKQRAYEIL